MTLGLAIAAWFQWDALKSQVSQLKTAVEEERLAREGHIEETRRALVIAETHANAARDAANTAQKTSEDNLNIALSQIDEARQSRILQHRPKLRVRNIVIKSPAQQYQAAVFTHGFPVCGQFYVSNIGGVRAHVVESHCEVLWNVNGLPMERPYEGKDGNNPLPGNPTIAAGSNASGAFNSGIAYNISGQIGVVGGVQVYVMGWIEYMDDAAIRRRTAFCRQFLHKDGSARFYPVNDPDYEYEE